MFSPCPYFHATGTLALRVVIAWSNGSHQHGHICLNVWVPLWMLLPVPVTAQTSLVCHTLS